MQGALAVWPRAVHVSSHIALGLRLFMSILQEHSDVSINAICGCLGRCPTSIFPTMRLPKETAQNIPMSPPAIPQAAFQIYPHIIGLQCTQIPTASKFQFLQLLPQLSRYSRYRLGTSKTSLS